MSDRLAFLDEIGKPWSRPLVKALRNRIHHKQRASKVATGSFPSGFPGQAHRKVTLVFVSGLENEGKFYGLRTWHRTPGEHHMAAAIVDGQCSPIIQASWAWQGCAVCVYPLGRYPFGLI